MVMTIICVTCGQYDTALDEIETLLAEPTWFSVNDFKTNEKLKPLRELPRFRQMMERYGA